MRKLRILAIASAIFIMNTMTSFANWEQQAGGQWKYQNDDGSYAVGWQWIDGNSDNVAECYYLDADGVLAVNTVVDGYTVDISGAWTVDGIVQTKAVDGTQSVDKSKSESKPVTNNYNNGVPLPSIGNVGSLDWSGECGDSTGLPPME